MSSLISHLIDKKNYSPQWKKKYHRTIWKHLLLRNWLQKLNTDKPVSIQRYRQWSQLGTPWVPCLFGTIDTVVEEIPTQVKPLTSAVSLVGFPLSLLLWYPYCQAAWVTSLDIGYCILHIFLHFVFWYVLYRVA